VSSSKSSVGSPSGGVTSLSLAALIGPLAIDAVVWKSTELCQCQFEVPGGSEPL